MVSRRRALGALLLALALVGCARAPAADRPLRVLYLAADAAGAQQLYLTDLAGAMPQPLTAAANGVVDYAAAPAGHAVLLTLARDDGGSDLWQIPIAADGAPGQPGVLLTCERVACLAPVWAPDNRRAVYERRTLAGSEPRLFWLDTQTGETLPVFSDDGIIGYNARFATDGRYLSFVNIGNSAQGENLAEQRVVVYDFTTGRQLFVPNLMNSAAVWHPREPLLIVTDMLFFGERFGIHLLRVDPATNAVDDLSVAAQPTQTVEDSGAAWSPDGSQIAFGRRAARTSMGSQVWLMAADGSAAQALTQDADLHHAQLQFSPDGAYLLFQQFDISRPDAVPAIGILTMQTKAVQLLVEGGARPQWLPWRND